MRSALLALLLLASVVASPAQGLKPEQLPQPLQGWLPWAWQGHEAERCPPAQQDAAQRHCLWPAALSLRADARGARFAMELHNLSSLPLRAALPGEAGGSGLWPQQLQLDGKPLAVSEHEGRPSALLPPGRHRIEGEFAWTQLPPTLLLPPALGSLQLSVNGEARAAVPATDGRLALSDEAAGTAPEGDALQAQVVRRIEDGVPARLVTQWQLTVSGKPREIALPLALAAGWQASHLDSPLPARLLPDGSLRLQARAGSWTVQLAARSLQPLKELALPKADGLTDETWVFAADAALRAVTVRGGVSVDPRQVPMPEDWRALPAWRLQPGEALSFVETRRGSATPPADQLRLQRRLWLDFDGGGFTMQDQLSGSFARSTRLTLGEPLQLGRAAVGGDDQPLTKLAGEAGSGFELRSLQAQVTADARLDGSARQLPASGWQLQVDAVQTTLQLPPGWQLLHAGGPDRVQGSWASRWTLWDAFFLLLAAVGAARLFGWQAGLLLGSALLAGLQLAGSPSTAWWLLLLAVLALQRVLAGHARAAQLLGVARHGVALALGLLLLAFAVQQFRLALHPQLELASTAPAEAVELSAPSAEVAAEARGLADQAERAEMAKRRVASAASPAASRLYGRPDPSARVPTGPGLPQWQWRSHGLSWQGPVSADASLSLWLLPPWATALWRVAAVLLLAFALWRLLRGDGTGMKRLGAVLAGLTVAGAAQAAAPPAEAAPPWPSEQQLGELRQRTNPPPACLPRCVEFARAQLTAQGARVQLRLELHAQAEVAFALPGQGRAWRPQRVLVNGEPAATRRGAQDELLAVAPLGVSQWLLEAELPASTAQLEVALPQPLRALDTQLSGWQLGGLDARGLPAGALQLTRATPAAGRDAERGNSQDDLAPLARITRRLTLGLDWVLHTQIERIDASRAPLTLRWALLPGEVLTDPAVAVTDGVATLQLGAGDSAELSSRLAPAAQLVWQARQEPNQVEVWELAATPMWRARWQGPAPVTHHSDEGLWSPRWQPWPGERLQLQLERPPASPGGQTLTLDAVHSRVQPGAQALLVDQRLSLRSSLGGEHRLQLPEGAELLALQLNDTPLPPQAAQGQVRLALTPGAHTVQLRWRRAQAMGLWMQTPQLGLGAPAVNDHLTVQLPPDRLLLLAGGPHLGPAVLLWSVMAVVALLAALLGRVAGWRAGVAALLLGLGLAPTSLAGLALVAAWFAALRLRAEVAPRLNRTAHNLLQVGLLLLTLLALGALLDALRVGLLGYPELLVAGNQSTAHQLQWFADRVAGATSSAWVLSLPIWVYRALMLLWALWLAGAALGWLRWAWSAASSGGLWRPAPPKASSATPAARPDDVETS